MAQRKLREVTLIAGATASGKSALSLQLAKESGAVIINTDSMQQYDSLRILTARPTIEEEQQAPHYLYGYLKHNEISSVGRWYEDVKNLLNNEFDADQPLIFVGGTGLYFRSLEGGLAQIPDVCDEVRLKWRKALEECGAAELHRILQQVDNEISKQLDISDGQRIVRALEVKESSGKSLLYWQQQKPASLLENYEVKRLILSPDPISLAKRIEARIAIMLKDGLLDEVREFLKLDVPAQSPLKKVIGLKQAIMFLKNEISLAEMLEKIATDTRRYAKRQRTWYRNQLDDSWSKVL